MKIFNKNWLINLQKSIIWQYDKSQKLSDIINLKCGIFDSKILKQVSPTISISIDEEVFKIKVGKIDTQTKEYKFVYDGTNWTLDGATVTLSEYGISYTGTAQANDYIFLTYTDESWYKRNVTNFINYFFYNIFNLKTANDFGLTIWGRILNFPRQVLNKNDGTVIDLSKEQYRFLLLGQVLKFNMTCTIPEINKYLATIFNDTENLCYVVDNLDMTISYSINMPISDEIRFLIDNVDFLPQPAGVRVQIGNIIYYRIEIINNQGADIKFFIEGTEVPSTQTENSAYIDVEEGTTVSWTVEKNDEVYESYYSQNGTISNIAENHTLNITLERIEELVLTINTGSDNKFIIPVSGKVNNEYHSYNWKIDWGDGTGFHTYSGTASSSSTGIAYDGSSYIANTQYIIRIRDNSSNAGWLSAFGFWGSSYTPTNALYYANKKKVVRVDGLLTSNMIRSSSSDSYVCAGWFDGTGCLVGDLSFDDGITSVGNYFCAEMFARVTSSINLGSTFKLPQELDSCGDYFCFNMFYNSSISTITSSFRLPRKLLHWGNNFCNAMFNSCLYLTQIPNTFVLPEERYINNSATNFCRYMFASGVTSGASGNLKYGARHFLESFNLQNKAPLNNSGWFYEIFAYTALEETISPATCNLVQSQYPTNSNKAFIGCSNANLTNCPSNWK